MAALPVVSGKEALRVFRRLGWEIHRRESSHTSLHKPGSPILLTIPDHKELGPGILRKLIRQAEISVETFVQVLRD